MLQLFTVSASASVAWSPPVEKFSSLVYQIDAISLDVRGLHTREIRYVFPAIGHFSHAIYA